MAQTSIVGYSTTPSGHRLVVQAGTHAFTTSATVATMTVHMRRILAALVSPNQVLAGVSKTKMVNAYIPFVSVTMFTQNLGGKGYVSRVTGSISGLKFSYTLIGQ